LSAAWSEGAALSSVRKTPTGAGIFRMLAATALKSSKTVSGCGQ